MLLNCGVEKTLQSPLDCKEIKPVHPKENQSWILIGRTDAEAETPILWPPNVKNWLIGKDPDAGKDWRQEEKGTTEDEMVEWHHPLDGHEFDQARRVGNGQGSLVCYSPWGHKESDTTEQLNWTEAGQGDCDIFLTCFRFSRLSWWPSLLQCRSQKDSFIYYLRVHCFFLLLLFLMWTILTSLLNLLQCCFCCMATRHVGD